MSPARHPYQEVVNNLVDYIGDASRLVGVIRERIDRQTKNRQREGGHGRGGPDVFHKTLNRAVAVAAVGAWEAFNEDLVRTAAEHNFGKWAEYKDWYPITGANGQIQTPNSRNVRRLYWALFQFDPIDAWSVAVTVAPVETQLGGSSWRVGVTTHSKRKAAEFLDGVVRIRHAFAHQDAVQARSLVTPLPGVATVGAGGKWNIGSHHAENAICCVLQLAILTTQSLSDHMQIPESLNWSKQLTGFNWSRYVGNSDAANIVSTRWRGSHPF
jgi:hypothetical protein